MMRQLWGGAIHHGNSSKNFVDKNVFERVCAQYESLIEHLKRENDLWRRIVEQKLL